MKTTNMTGGLDSLVARLGIVHPVVQPAVRNQILLTLVAFFVGTAAAPENYWFLWFAAGFALMTYILISWARFFLRAPIGEFGPAFFRAFFLHFLLRLVVIAAALFAGILWAGLQPIPLLAGVAAGTFAPLLTIVWERVRNRRIL